MVHSGWTRAVTESLKTTMRAIGKILCALSVSSRATTFALPEFRYTVTEYDPAKPWLIVGPLRRETVQLDDSDDFATWAARAWPGPRFRAQLEPEPLAPWDAAD